MKIAIIGAGNVASVLGRLMRLNNLTIVQVASRNIHHAKVLADELGATFTDFNGLLDVTADVYVIALADAAIAECFPFLKPNNKIVVHTAGSISKDILQSVSSNYGVLYPLQTLRKEMPKIPPIPFLIDGNNEDTIELITTLAKQLSHNVQVSNDQSRMKIHLAAVMVNNFTNHLYAMAEDFCNKEKLDFNMLKPLISETASRISASSPSNLQTGPAIRNDIQTIDKHLSLLMDYPQIKAIYLKLTDSIINFNNKE